MKNILFDQCQDPAILQELKTEGYKLFHELYPKAYCQEAIHFIDSNKHGLEEYHYSDSELRIWGAETTNPLMKLFFDDSIRAYNRIFGKNTSGEKLLAISNMAIKPEDESSRLGRWHIDSFFNQWKVFLFLMDADENTGPFEFIPGTHPWHFRLRQIRRYMKLTDFLKGTRSYASLSDQWISKVRKKKPSMPVVCKAGTVLIVSTNAIHRARPCYAGTRYALTTYI